jgi:hypothetical protein
MFLPGSPVDVGDVLVIGGQRYRVAFVSRRGDDDGDAPIDATLE